MFKNSFDGTGIHFLCDCCKRIVASNHNFNRDPITWEAIYMKPRTEGATRRRLDFCDERCRIVFLRGRKYFQRKLEHMKANGCLD